MNEKRLDIEKIAPVEFIAIDAQRTPPEPGIALCLSGGGYRAMLFHLGSLWRLNQTGLLRRLERISSVSGGSIAAATLGRCWNQLAFAGNGVASNFVDLVVAPVRSLARKTIDIGAVLAGIFLPGTVGDRIARAYSKHLFGETTLQDLPEHPRFVINATNVQSGALWRFMRPYMRDYRVGEIPEPAIPLAVAVAASSAFPPVLSPVRLSFQNDVYTPSSGLDLQRSPYTTNVMLTDGGVYDNLGLETAWKRYRTIFVSDGGGTLQPDPNPRWDWPRHALRVVDQMGFQIASLRKRQLILSYIDGVRDGTYWGIRTDIRNYDLADCLPCPRERTSALADTPTRLARLSDTHQERLINWGYAVCDAALRKHFDPTLPRPVDFVYPAVGV